MAARGCVKPTMGHLVKVSTLALLKEPSRYSILYPVLPFPQLQFNPPLTLYITVFYLSSLPWLLTNFLTSVGQIEHTHLKMQS